MTRSRPFVQLFAGAIATIALLGAALAPRAHQQALAQTRQTETSVSTPTPETAARIDALMAETLHRQHLAGVSLAIGSQGQVVYAKGYGYRNLATKLPATAETIYNIASMSKQFTAACVLLLQQDGKLNINDKLAKFLPGFPNGNHITIREVLNHTSGLSDYLNTLDNATLTPAKVRTAVYQVKSKFPPGTKYEYSNTNYIVAGLVVEAASGMSYDAFLRRRILVPLQLHSTTVGTAPLDFPNGAVGYTVKHGQTVPVDPRLDSVAVLDYPDGGVNTSVLDLIRWDDALDRGAVIDRQSLQEMFTPSGFPADWPGGYALGVGVDHVAGMREIVHTGGWDGFTGENATLPEQRFAVVMVSNTDTFDKRDLTRRIMQMFFPSQQRTP